MKKTQLLTAFLVLLLGLSGIITWSAPNSGDGIPDGPGWSEDFPMPGLSNGPGPAPNSGDGIPDGSGF